MKQILEQMKQIWTGGSPTQRALGVLSLLVLVVGIGGGVWYASRPDFTLLFGGLDPADAASIVDEVKKAGVAAEVRGGGTAVYVPRDRVDEMRMIAASAGLPKSSGSGWELFDKSSFGVSDFVQNLNFLRALQTELARAIEQFEAVDTATVQITRGKPSAFVSQDKSAKASVILATRSGRVLSGENVRAITNLVAGAVEGLDPANVSVTDTKGRLLSEAGERSLALNTGSQVEYQQDYEEYLRRKAQELLDVAQIQGTVTVRLKLDFQHVRQTSEKFDPTGTVTSETIESRNSNNGTTGPGGALSTKDQISGQTSSAPSGETSTETEETTKTEMKVGRTVTSEENATPKIERMFISLVLHDSQKDLLKQVEELVKSTVGFETQRGDVMSSLTKAYEVTATPVGDAPESAPVWPQLVERGVEILGILAALFVLFKLIKMLEAKPAPALTAEQLAARVAAGDQVEEEEQQVYPPPISLSEVADQAVKQGATLPDVVRATVKADPVAATRVLQNWLHDGERN